MNRYNMPKVSVIMGIYNCESTLEESIESILNQTYTNWELIMCDDMSTDNTYSIAKTISEKHKGKIKLIKNNKNLGLAATLNNCLRYTTGDLIARQDGDDISLKDRFEKQVKFLSNNKEYDLVGSKMISFDQNGDNGIRGGDIEIPQKIDLSKSNPFSHATIMARAYVYKELNGYRVNKYTLRAEDADLWFRFYAKGYKGYNLQEPLYKVREDINAYRRRTFKSYLNLIKVNLDGYRMVDMPISKYIYLLKPIISAITPRYFMKIYHQKICSTKINN